MILISQKCYFRRPRVYLCNLSNDTFIVNYCLTKLDIMKTAFV